MRAPDPYSVFDFYKEEGKFQHIARHQYFENVTLAVISLNAVYIAIDTDWNKEYPLTSAETFSLQDSGVFFQFMEHSFCLYFTAEWIIRFMAFQNKRNCIRDGWFTFDSALVFLMVMETWILTIVGGSMGNTAILRLFRLLRLSRLVRMLRSLPELMILIKGMITAMKSVFYVMALLVLITYIFAIAFTQLSVGTETLGDTYFSNVPLAMYSLLIYTTFLDDLSAFMDDCRAEEGRNWYLIVIGMAFICLASLTVMNMLVGVLCEVVSAVAATEKEEMMQENVSNNLQGVLAELDKNFNKKISYEEFSAIIEKPRALRGLAQIGVDPIGIVDLAELFFFDHNQPIELDFSEFMDMVLSLRESNTATVKDMLRLWSQVKTNVNLTILQIQDKLEKLNQKLDERTAVVEGQIALVLSEARKITKTSIAMMSTPSSLSPLGHPEGGPEECEV